MSSAAAESPVSVANLLARYSIEVTARDSDPAAACAGVLRPGTEVFIAFVPSARHERVAAIAGALAAAGFVPVPHLVARSFRGYTQLLDHLLALRAAGVEAALVIGGDSDRAEGPYTSALALLQTGAFARVGIRRIGLACYPEPHRRVDQAHLDAALDGKLARVTGDGAEAFLVSQFCLQAEPIVALAQSLRRRGIAAPLRIGIAGPTDRRKLWKYALRCGIGASIAALGSRIDVVRDLLIRETPDALVHDLAARLAPAPPPGITGLHIFSFGGVTSAAAWANTLRAGGIGDAARG
jgi:methylenetetrahydrofolate reductase (NADPH)